MRDKSDARRTDIGAKEWSKETGGGEFKPSRAEEPIERMALAPIRIFCATGIVVHGQNSG